MFQESTNSKCFWTVSRAYADRQTVCEGPSIPWGHSESAFPVLWIIAPSIGKRKAKKGTRWREGKWWRGEKKRGMRKKRETDQYEQSFNLRLYYVLKVLVEGSAKQVPLCKTASPMMQSADNKEKTAVQKSYSMNMNLYRLIIVWDISLLKILTSLCWFTRGEMNPLANSTIPVRNNSMFRCFNWRSSYV